MGILTWVFRGLVFAALFAFALNNQHDVVVHGLFGRQWHAPLVIVLLATLMVGCLLGILAMMPSWWRRRTVAQRNKASPAAPADAAKSTPTPQVPDAVVLVRAEQST
jgi:lipopolysaccharide assembly protein A